MLLPNPTEEVQSDLDIIGDENTLPVEDPSVPEVAEVEQTDEDAEAEEKEIDDALKNLIDYYERKEQPTREKMLRFFRKCELFWDGVQDIIWDQTAKDYRSTTQLSEEKESTLDPYYYNKIINIYRAYGEAVIAALTPETPPIIFPPDDADNIDDVNTSKAYTRISELIAKHNNASLLLIRAIFVLWNQGVIGSYRYVKTSEEYGTYQKPIEQEEIIPREVHSCPSCGGQNIQPSPEMGGMTCPDCGYTGEPDVEVQEERVPRIIGYENIPKSRQCIETYGPKDFEIPHYVTDPKHTPYVSLKTECHYTYAAELYGRDDFQPNNDPEQYDRWAREHTEYSDNDDDQVTIRRTWLRSWTFNYFKGQPELIAKLKARYPNGVRVELVNDTVVKKEAENLDDCWTFTMNPLSSHLHAKPLGAPLVPIQEINNELLLLKMQHVEYGIPETFADPASLDFATFGDKKSAPGMVSPARALPGKGLDASFTTLKTAAYPKEVNDFQAELESSAQFVVGAFPTIYGGAISGGGKTAAEYNMSRSQALQRLGTIWKFITVWWAQTMGKAVVSFHENMLTDEKIVKKNGQRFENVWIRKADMQGSIGQVEPEVGDNFPSSQAQKRDLLIQLMQLNNEYINSAIFSTENATITSELLGFREFSIPGEADRAKQLEEINELLVAEPLDEMGQIPSIQVDMELDNHQIEAETGINWLKSDIGRDARVNNPAGYANVRAHIIQHQQVAAMQAQQQAMAEAEANDSGNDSGSDDSGGSFSEESD